MVSLFDKPEFTFDEKSVTISGSSGASVEYYYSEPSLLSVPTKQITMPDAEVSFTLKQKHFAELQKASSVLQVSDLAVRTDGDMHNLQFLIRVMLQATVIPSTSVKLQVGKTSVSTLR